MDEPLDFDRSFFQKEYAPVISEERVMHGAFDSISMIHPVKYYRSMDEEFPYLMGVGLSHKVGIGNCVQQAVSEAMILRSVGIPATVDYVPQWGNYPGRHFMTKLVDNKNKSTFEMSLSDFKFVIPKDSLHESISGIQYVKIVPKVYRMTWSVQPDRLLLNSGDRTEKTGLFRNLCEKDVTDEYTECSTFRVQVKDTVEKIAYLCVFGRDGWTPVCASPIDGNEAVFEKIGRGIVYLPVLFRDEDSFQPIGNPFYFTDEGTYIALTGKGGKTQHAKLYSKYPVCSYTAVHTYRMKGGKFQGANTPGFSDAKTLFTIDYYPFYKQEIKIGSDEKFRYFRYLPPPNVIYSFSELQFYTQDENNSLKQMQGSYFEQHKSVGLDFASLSDNDLDTYVKGAPVKNSWLGYDTGKNNDSKLTKIVFAPQNDGNCIIPGYFYELSYWNNNKWNSLGIKRAKDHFLEYANLPQQALFWLKCHTRGKEERIFTLENGIQIWW
ncbi:hypothetical protein [Dysgonomonas mossii]|uniref:hypothetical protein n=1 Tax=Dysgonomonas mossii TaxID=163665 RepID=UPI0039951858